MSEIKVSVIVPVYNTEKYLVNCLESLVNQTLQEIQIVIINDGSTDSSLEIIKSYSEKYPNKIVYETQENSGQAVARNRALELCTGEYIGFLDSDDFVKKEMYQKMYEKAIAQDADYVACGYTDITYKDEKKIILHQYVASKKAVCQKDLFFGALVSPFIHIYRREIIEKSQVRFPEKVIYEDTAFYLNLIPYIKKIAVIEEALAYRVRRRNSTMTIVDPYKVGQIFKVMDESISYYKKYGFWNEYKEELTYFTAKLLLCSSMKRICKVKNTTDRKKLIQQTMAYLNEKLPDYKKNKYARKGMINLYYKSANKYTLGVYTLAIRIASKFERDYV